MSKQNECHELKNIQYQTMLINSKIPKEVNDDEVNKIDNFLANEKKMNCKKTWNKLGKAMKLKKIINYVNEYVIKNNMNSKKRQELKQYLLTCLHRKKLQRVKDVLYSVEDGKIVDIPGLAYNKNKFTLKRMDKKNTTSKCLLILKRGNKYRITLTFMYNGK